MTELLKKAVERSKATVDPLVVTIAGEAGRGKTTMAASFPKPFFVMVENGLRSIPEKDRPDGSLIPSVDFLWNIMKALGEEDHDYQTIVIDSVTKLDDMFAQHVIENDPKKPKGLNQALGGFGNGPAAVGALHLRLRKECEHLKNKKGVNIVFIAHATVESIDLPDSEPFMRYSVRLGKNSIAPYRDDVDVVGFVRQQMFLRGEDGERKKAVSTQVREFVCTLEASSIAKNRLNITQPMPFEIGTNPLDKWVNK